MFSILKVVNVMNVVLLANVIVSVVGLNKYISYMILLLVAGFIVLITRVAFDNELTYETDVYSKSWYKTMAILSLPILLIALVYYKEVIFFIFTLMFVVLFYFINRFIKVKDLI